MPKRIGQVAWQKPPELTAKKLVRLKDLSISWTDQREYLDGDSTNA